MPAFTQRIGRRVIILTAVGVFVAAGLLLGVPWSDSSIKIEKDDQRDFRIDPDQPYVISLSRNGTIVNSGKTVVIHQGGRVVMERSTEVYKKDSRALQWETATFALSPELQAALLEAIETNRLMDLHRSYRKVDVYDGEGLGLSIKQGEHEKRVSCMNYFPESLVRFENQLQMIVSRYQKDLKWRPTDR